MRRFLYPRIFCSFSGILPAFLIVCAVQSLQAQTTWNAGVAVWDAPGSWTGGEPELGEDFFINNDGTAQITVGIEAVGNLGTFGDLIGESGSLSISGGSLTASSELRVGNEGTGSVTISGSAQVNALGVVLGRQTSGTGALNLDGGVLTTLQVSTGSGSGSVTFNSGTLQLAAAQLDLFSGVAAVNIGPGGATIDTLVFEATTSAAFSGTGGLRKTGSGKLTFLGNSEYSGITTVEAGMLQVDGSITSNVVVKGGATLGGDGIVGGIVLEDGGTLIPVDCFDGNSLTWEAGASMVYGTSGFGDILELTGDLLKDGDGTFAFTFQGTEWQVGQQYALIFFNDTTFVESDFSFTNGGGFDGTFTLEENALQFTVLSVPEPSTCALGLAGLLVAFAGSRRRANRR